MTNATQAVDGDHSVRDLESGEKAAVGDGAGTHVIKGNLFRIRDGHGFRFSEQAPPPAPEPVRRPAHVARMLAWAHRLQAAINRGDYRDRADLARCLGLTRARVTQLLDLTLLAPDIQEEILFLEAVDGVEPISERMLRRLTSRSRWNDQRIGWEPC